MQDSSIFDDALDPFSEQLEDPNVTDPFDVPSTCSVSVDDGHDSGEETVRLNTSTEEQKLKYAIVKSFLKQLNLAQKQVPL